MKIYVDEKPESCATCCCRQDIKVNAGADRLLLCLINNKFIKNMKKCPLHSIKELELEFEEKMGVKDKDYYVIEAQELQKIKNGCKELIKEAKQEVRKQVCDEIRENLKKQDFIMLNDERIIDKSFINEPLIKQKDFISILDQIEKGDKE